MHVKEITNKRKGSLGEHSHFRTFGISLFDYLTLETSKRGYEHILAITDHFTNYYYVAILTQNQTAKTTA